MMEDCSGGRVRHPATHQETVRLRDSNNPRHAPITETGYVCSDHKTSADDWEVDDWEVVSIKRSKL